MTPAGTSNELDVQNGWEENTHTHIGTCLLNLGILIGTSLFFFFFFPVQQTTSGIGQASSNTSGTDFNTHASIKIPKFKRHVPIKILKFNRHAPIKIIFFTKHLSIKEMRRQSSKFTKDHATQHIRRRMRPSGCRPSRARTKVALLAPEVGHRLAIVNPAHQI